jgi:hypothetical protein
MDRTAWFGPQGVLSSGDPAHIFDFRFRVRAAGISDVAWLELEIHTQGATKKKKTESDVYLADSHLNGVGRYFFLGRLLKTFWGKSMSKTFRRKS